MHTHMCTDHTTCKNKAVVASNVTAPRVCTLVLFITSGNGWLFLVITLASHLVDLGLLN